MVLLTVAGPACAAGDAGEDGPTTTASEDQRRSDQLLLSPFDLPDGFDEDLDESRTSEFHQLREECLIERGAKPTDALAGGEAVDLSTDAALIGSASNIFATDELAHRRVDLLRSAEFRRCFGRSLEEAFDEEVKRRRREVPGFRIELAELPFPAIADEVVAYRTMISAGVRGRDLFLDTVYLRVQRVVGSYIFLGFGRAVPAGLQEEALRSAASRIVSLHVYSTPTLAPGTPPTTGGVPDRRLNGITLAKSDFPLGWFETKAPPLAVDAEAAFRRCLGLRDHLDRPWINSPHFRYGNAATAASITVLARSEDESARWLAAAQGPRLVDCIRQRFDHELTLTAPPGVRPTPSRSEALPFPPLGDGAAAVRVQATLPNDVEDLTLTTDFVFVKSGRFELVLILTDTPTPFPADIASSVGEKLAARARGAGP